MEYLAIVLLTKGLASYFPTNMICSLEAQHRAPFLCVYSAV